MRDWLVGGALIESADGLLLVRNRRRDGSHDWSTPGGVIEEGEDLLVGLAREVEEETGLVVTEWAAGPLYEVRILAPVGAIEYFFTQGGERIHKTVHYFLMEAIGGSLEAHDHEFDEVRWLPIDEARRMMTFETERQIVEEALPVAQHGPA